MSTYNRPDDLDGWHWGIGEAGDDYYLYWLYSDLRFHYQAMMDYHGDEHVVRFFEETGLTSDGDIKVCEYPCRHDSFETEEAALEYLIETAEDLIDY